MGLFTPIQSLLGLSNTWAKNQIFSNQVTLTSQTASSSNSAMTRYLVDVETKLGSFHRPILFNETFSFSTGGSQYVPYVLFAGTNTAYNTASTGELAIQGGNPAPNNTWARCTCDAVSGYTSTSLSFASPFIVEFSHNSGTNPSGLQITFCVGENDGFGSFTTAGVGVLIDVGAGKYTLVGSADGSTQATPVVINETGNPFYWASRIVLVFDGVQTLSLYRTLISIGAIPQVYARPSLMGTLTLPSSVATSQPLTSIYAGVCNQSGSTLTGGVGTKIKNASIINY